MTHVPPRSSPGGHGNAGTPGGSGGIGGNAGRSGNAGIEIGGSGVGAADGPSASGTGAPWTGDSAVALPGGIDASLTAVTLLLFEASGLGSSRATAITIPVPSRTAARAARITRRCDVIPSLSAVRSAELSGIGSAEQWGRMGVVAAHEPRIPRLLTVGHGTLLADALSDLLTGAGVELVVDVRTSPGSRRHPHFGRDRMAVWLPDAGIGYRWEPDLGGWRSARPDSPHVALRDKAFRGYADHMETAPFVAAADRLLDAAGDRPTAAMCSESLWWKCHRRLLSDFAVLVRGVDVAHLGHDGRLTVHEPTAGARVESGRLVYDAGQAELGPQAAR